MPIFVFDGKGAVETKELPSGDMAVWHPINDDLRQIVEPICRDRGHWKAEFKNWIVFRQFADEVLSELEAVGRRIT